MEFTHEDDGEVIVVKPIGRLEPADREHLPDIGPQPEQGRPTLVLLR